METSISVSQYISIPAAGDLPIHLVDLLLQALDASWVVCP